MNPQSTLLKGGVRFCSLWPIYYSLIVETNDIPRSSTMLVLPGCYCCTVNLTTVH